MGNDFKDSSAQLAKIKSQEMWEKGASIEQILYYLRQQGFPQGISVFILQRATKTSHFEAKKAVTYSEVWADYRQANVKLRNAIANIFDEGEKDGK